ncbi:uncharacterized protein ColSpa_00877 [Colletotrichum spaethianum]|uniref:Uncharacterized protein n=1 Tax=Colletotrichum spaethianum TaxID=700344 RepID=A0AA37L2W3_9PEZI|nr:uncharacterized protein ColSpa_00877 [Colletotrichum spaethianum]GKT40696.1 hypothetical protein ColSpa_00877 [Colletotrichum spaethianum]
MTHWLLEECGGRCESMVLKKTNANAPGVWKYRKEHRRLQGKSRKEDVLRVLVIAAEVKVTLVSELPRSDLSRQFGTAGRPSFTEFLKACAGQAEP